MTFAKPRTFYDDPRTLTHERNVMECRQCGRKILFRYSRLCDLCCFESEHEMRFDPEADVYRVRDREGNVAVLSPQAVATRTREEVHVLIERELLASKRRHAEPPRLVACFSDPKSALPEPCGAHGREGVPPGPCRCRW
ncbi:MAG: hypothetical protein IT381_05080 [Deltaproteobacteria bacterium]|nr:hypothetical protein [Deltaproteobacteria bacterium]